MAHGAPDWGAFESLSTIYRVTDLGELAARLNVVNTYDRRGNVVWWDDFEDNINKWEISAPGAGAAVALSSDTARSGGKCAKLTAGTSVNTRCHIYRRLGSPLINTKLGFEFSYALENTVLVELFFQSFTGESLVQGGFRYNQGTQLLQYYDQDGNWSTLDDSLMIFPIISWLQCKLVVDTTGTAEYVRFLITDKSYDMSGLYPRFTASTIGGYLGVRIAAIPVVETSYNMYVDDFIITQNEP